jgi:acyl-ACP thioesterase
VTQATARVFEHAVRAGLADTAASGRVRLDAIARWLQDAAWHDVDDAGLSGRAGWVVRRMRLRVERFPVFGDRVVARTHATGYGLAWAERRTTIEGERAFIEADALWVQVDPASGRPVPLDESFHAVYGAAVNGRQVKARLRHPGAPPDAEPAAWRFRATDLDLVGHVNNAAYWAPVEEELLTAGHEPERFDAEIEFRGGAIAGDAVILRAGERRWIAQPADEVVASLVLGVD